MKGVATYPPADITPSQFEGWVAELYRSVGLGVENVRVTPHEVVEGVDGAYDLDATVRYEWAGLEFLVLVEAKRHRHPIKRELVASLQSKILSTGAQKGVLFATAPFQRGALQFARTHGIALVYVTEGRYTVMTRSADQTPAPSREEAAALYGLPTFVGFAMESGEGDAVSSTILSSEYIEYLDAVLLAGAHVA